MKIPYKHFVKHIDSKPSIEELSDKLFQLGHEHEIFDEIFDMELTPNRGDCLSLNGLLRDLGLFYSISIEKDIYIKDIKPFKFEFINDASHLCKNISFLKLDIDQVPKNYNKFLENYFTDLNVKKINFFTDISNYISYETGQPTHCYDSLMIDDYIRLGYQKDRCEFETLTNKKIYIDSGDLVFFDKDNKIINLAGVMGGKDTACKVDTKSVLIECAHFNSEAIIGRSLKYDINSDAAHKFERETDAYSHDFVLRRFIKIVENHSNIKNIELFNGNNEERKEKIIPFDFSKINNILGIDITENECSKYLQKLNFLIDKNTIKIPSYRNDVNNINDIAEEIARAIGYDNIKKQKINISVKNNFNQTFIEHKIKKLLTGEGFFEVINNPFVSDGTEESVVVDNPLDSNKKYVRTNLKNSLIENLLYNERRQKDSIKLFEIADLYTNKTRIGKRVIGIIASGRIDKNYLNFSKKIDINYLESILHKISYENLELEEISRQSLDSKLKNKIVYCELEIKSSIKFEFSYENFNIKHLSEKKYTPISEFPSSNRDLSFSIKDFSKCKILEEFILNFENALLKEVFVFDYFKNEKMNEIKIGFRFIFQSKDSTVTDNEVDTIIDEIISGALKYDSVSVPGLV
ncbi:MAG: hypothetical protein CMQ77_03725 [Gammaproteobacteria bacterium]|nr:hypothetical protein [Gammaproteobacteria bacterium]